VALSAVDMAFIGRSYSPYSERRTARGASIIARARACEIIINIVKEKGAGTSNDAGGMLRVILGLVRPG